MKSPEEIKARLARREQRLEMVLRGQSTRRKDYFAKEYLPLKGEVEVLRWVLGKGSA